MLQVAAVWTWLAQRFGGELFPGIEEVRDTTQQMVQLMEQGLQVCGQTLLLPATALSLLSAILDTRGRWRGLRAAQHQRCATGQQALVLLSIRETPKSQWSQNIAIICDSSMFIQLVLCVQELSERSAAELVQRQQRRQQRQSARSAPAGAAPSNAAPGSGGVSNAAKGLQHVQQAPAAAEAQQLVTALAQRKAPSIGGSSSDGSSEAGDAPASLWQRVAGGAPPPHQQLRRHRQRNADPSPGKEPAQVGPSAPHPVACEPVAAPNLIQFQHSDSR